MSGYIKRSDKIRIVRWYIKKYINTEINVDDVTDLKILENIIRTQPDCFGRIDKCKGCHYAGRDFEPKCSNCQAWHWDKNVFDEKDNYAFRYGHFKTFCDTEGDF